MKFLMRYTDKTVVLMCNGKGSNPMKSKYHILRITEWGTVHYIDDNLKHCAMQLQMYIKYCCV